MGKVCKALRLHMNSAEVAEAASAALLSLTLNGRNTASRIRCSNPYILFLQVFPNLRNMYTFLFLLCPNLVAQCRNLHCVTQC